MFLKQVAKIGEKRKQPYFDSESSDDDHPVSLLKHAGYLIVLVMRWMMDEY